jgi:ribosomal protein S7
MQVAKRSSAFFRFKNELCFFDYKLILVKIFMRHGFKLFSYKILNKFFFLVKMHYNLEINVLLDKAFNAYIPILNFIKKKVAARIIELPVLVNQYTAKFMLIRWFIRAVVNRTENKLIDRFLNEFNDLMLGYGRTVKYVEDFYMLALKSRPFLHFLRKKRKVFLSRLKKFGIRK